MKFDRKALVEEAEEVLKNHKGIFIMSDEDLSYLVVGCKEKEGGGWYSKYVKSLPDLAGSAEFVKKQADANDRSSPAYFCDTIKHEEWIASEKRNSLI